MSKVFLGLLIKEIIIRVNNFWFIEPPIKDCSIIFRCVASYQAIVPPKNHYMDKFGHYISFEIYPITSWIKINVQQQWPVTTKIWCANFMTHCDSYKMQCTQYAKVQGCWTEFLQPSSHPLHKGQMWYLLHALSQGICLQHSILMPLPAVLVNHLNL